MLTNQTMSKNSITAINIHTGIRGKWQQFTFKLMLLKKLFKSNHFVAIHVTLDEQTKVAHYELLLHGLMPRDAEQVCHAMHDTLRGQRMAAEGANNILNNQN